MSHRPFELSFHCLTSLVLYFTRQCLQSGLLFSLLLPTPSHQQPAAQPHFLPLLASLEVNCESSQVCIVDIDIILSCVCLHFCSPLSHSFIDHNRHSRVQCVHQCHSVPNVCFLCAHCYGQPFDGDSVLPGHSLVYLPSACVSNPS